MQRPGNTNFSPTSQPKFLTKSWRIINQHFIKSNPSDHINMVIAINHLHLLTHHDVDHPHHYFGYDQKTKKKTVQIKHFDRPQIDR